MKDNEIAELVNEITKIAKLHHDKQCLRTLMSRAVTTKLIGKRQDVITDKNKSNSTLHWWLIKHIGLNMLYKHYTCDLLTINGEPLRSASMTVKVWMLTSPCNVSVMIKNQLERDKLYNHKFYNLRRIS
jgi:hypothetical protein